MPRVQYDSSVDRKPFMDKISNNVHMPPPKVIYKDDENSQLTQARGYNSTTVFPSLKHTGLKTNYLPEDPPSNSPDGRITTNFKIESIDLMRKIYRDEIAMKNKEAQFKLAHRKDIQTQFKTYNTQSQQKIKKLNTIRNDFTNTLTSGSFCSDFNISMERSRDLQTDSPNKSSGLKDSSLHDNTGDQEKKMKKRCASRLAIFNQLLESS